MSSVSTIAQGLRSRRLESGLTQAEVASRAGVSRPTVSGLENGAKGQWVSLVEVLRVLELQIVGTDRICAARHSRGLSIAEASRRAGLARPTVRQIERTGRGRVETVEALARVVGVSLRLGRAGRFYGADGVGNSSDQDEWYTPPEIVRAMTAAGLHYSLDPCCPGIGLTPVLADRYLSLIAGDDGLAADWSGESVYCNPPYSSLRLWLNKCAAEAERGARVVALVPARPDTRAWRDNVARRAHVVFLPGRVRFLAPDGLPRPGSSIPRCSGAMASSSGCRTAASGRAAGILAGRSRQCLR